MGRPATLRIDILADASKASRELDSVGGKLGKFGAVAGAAAAGAALAVGAFAVSAVKSASEVEQAFGGVEAIFGSNADAVKRLANDAARDVGLAASEYGNLANVLGSQLKNMGTSAEQLVPQTDTLIKLGADLAATFGGSTADAVSAVSSLLKGERDPIEKYGVSIKAADVQARLAAQGLDGLTGAARTQAETQATLALLTEQTAAAQGSFAREGNTLAGQQQRLGAIWENLKATVGAGLLPVLSQLGAFLLDRVVPASQRLAEQMRAQLGPTLQTVGAFIRDRVVPAAQLFVSWFQDRIAPGLQRSLIPALQGGREAFRTVQDAIDRNRPALERIFAALRTVAEFVASRVAPVVGTVLGAAFRTVGSAIGGFLDLVSSIVGTVDRAVRAVQRLIDKLQNSAIGRGVQAVGSFLGFSAPVGAAVQAARLAPAATTAALGGPSGAGLLGLSVRAGDVYVQIGDEPIRATVRREVKQQQSALARRVRSRVGAA